MPEPWRVGPAKYRLSSAAFDTAIWTSDSSRSDGRAALPSCGLRAAPRLLLDQHHRHFGKPQHLVRGGTEPVGRRADTDEVAAGALRVLYDHLRRIADQDSRFIAQTGAVERFLCRPKRLCSLLLVVAVELRLADRGAETADLRHWAVYRD